MMQVISSTLRLSVCLVVCALIVSSSVCAQRPTVLRTIDTNKDTRLTGIALSPDGRTLAVGHYAMDNKVLLWDVESGKEKAHLSTEGLDHPVGLSYSLNGELLASGSSIGIVRAWDVNKGEISTDLRGHEEASLLKVASWDPVVSKNGNRMAIVIGELNKEREVHLIDLVPIVLDSFPPVASELSRFSVFEGRSM